MIIFMTQKKLNALIDARIKTALNVHAFASAAAANKKERSQRGAAVVIDSYAPAPNKKRKSSSRTPNGITIMEACDLVLSDGKKRNVSQTRRQVANIYGKVSRSSTNAALYKLMVAGKVERIGHGLCVADKQ